MNEAFVTFCHVLSRVHPKKGVNLSCPVTCVYRHVTNVTTRTTELVNEKSSQDATTPAPALIVADQFDDRATCQTCARLWPTPTGAHACTDHRRAGLTTRDLAADFVTLLQRCPAWSAKS
jgi:hypothetical protein